MKDESGLLLGWDDDLRGMDAGQFVLELFEREEFGDLEVAGRQIDQRQPELAGIVRDGGEEIVLLGVEEARVEVGAGTENLRDIALDELAGLTCFATHLFHYPFCLFY